jgi:hypothetical protein
MFDVGDKVKWESHGGGGSTVKQGIIVHRFFKQDNCAQDTPGFAIRNFPKHKIMFDGFGIPGGGDVGYFVEVKTGPKAMPRLYKPFTCKLELVNDGGKDHVEIQNSTPMVRTRGKRTE